MSRRIVVELCSPPDRERLVAAVLVDGEQWVEINQEQGRLELEIYPRRDGSPWSIGCDEAIEALVKARAGLLERS